MMVVINIIELNKIYCMDCLEGMKLIDDNSIDLVVTSPPYDAIRDYKGFTLDLHAAGVEIGRALKDGGMCVMVIQDQTKNGRKSLTSFRTIVDWVDNTPMDLWECCIYYRHGVPGAWWSKRFRVDHEYIPIFIKGDRPQYFNKEHMKESTNPKYKTWKIGTRNADGTTTYDRAQTRTFAELKARGTVMNYLSSSQETPKNSKEGSLKLKHPATFPDKLAADFIQAFTLPDMVVLDPFMGSGTTAVVAKRLARKYIGFEISQDYVRIAEERIELEDKQPALF
jgi:DNA modification methylase